MELSAMCATVMIRKYEIQRLVQGIKENGISMLRTTLGKASMVLEECYKDLERIYLGIQHLPVKLMHSLMTSLLLSHKEATTLHLHDFIALKQFVLHVVW